MTLIVTTTSPTVTTMVGDRRLSNLRGIADDDAGKQGHWSCCDASMLYGYTGLARAENFDMPSWIVNTLISVAKEGNYSFLHMVSLLATELTNLMKNHPSLKTAPDKRTTIIFAGFMGNGDPASAIVSNFENFSCIPLSVAMVDFEWISRRGRNTSGSSASACFLTGYFDPVGSLRLTQLNALILGNKSIKSIRQKSIGLIEGASEALGIQGSVGKKIMAATLLAPVNGICPSASSIYVTDEPTSSIAALDMVKTTSNHECKLITDIRITKTDGLSFRFPIQSRNERCRCGSGKKHKRCCFNSESHERRQSGTKRIAFPATNPQLTQNIRD